MGNYNEKRDFTRTKEPKDNGSRSAGNKPIFVIQKHDANNLHYDFRLQIDGTLKSWAVPKGPSTNPSVKRMAVPTEDHPMAYADFEGTIPEDSYGGGTVMIWDKGNIKSNKKDEEGNTISLEASFNAGSIEVDLDGKKLKGGYNLIKMEGGKMKGNWLLMKQDDTYADTTKEAVKSDPESAVTERDLQKIREEEKD